MDTETFKDALNEAYSRGLSDGHPLGSNHRQEMLAELVQDYADHLSDGPGNAPSLANG